MRGGCGWKSGRWGGSAAGGWLLTGLFLVPGRPLLGAHLFELCLCLHGIVLHDPTFLETLAALRVGMPDETDRTRGVGLGKTSLDLRIVWRMRKWRRLVAVGGGGVGRGGCARGGGVDGIGSDCCANADEGIAHCRQ